MEQKRASACDVCADCQAPSVSPWVPVYPAAAPAGRNHGIALPEKGGPKSRFTECREEKNMENVKRFVRDESGQNLIEYALLAALISLVIVVAAPPVRTAITNIFNYIANQLGSALPASG